MVRSLSMDLRSRVIQAVNEGASRREAADSTASKAEAPKFQVRPEHVGLVMTVDEIEAAERVTDPLGAVPNLPFGHLNKAWRRFLSQMPAGGSLAHFSAEWTAPWGGQERLDGYVVVDGGRLGPFWACRATRG